MALRIDLTGRKFGRLTVLEFAGFHPRGRKSLWVVRCDCGGPSYVVSGDSLTNKSSRARSHPRSCRRLECPFSARKHGHSRTIARPSPEYRAWQGMKDRCLNANNQRFLSYGGRGIKVCPQWVDSFESFLADVGPRPSNRHSIDRIDNNGHYEPGNVRWALTETQARNKRTNALITWRGQSHCLTDWAKVLGLSCGTLVHRYQRGWPVEEMLNPSNATPIRDIATGRLVSRRRASASQQ